MYTNIPVCTHAYIHTIHTYFMYICTGTYINMHTCIHTHMHYIHEHTHTHTHIICPYIHTYTHTHTYNMPIHTYTHTHTYIHTHRKSSVRSGLIW